MKTLLLIGGVFGLAVIVVFALGLALGVVTVNPDATLDPLASSSEANRAGADSNAGGSVEQWPDDDAYLRDPGLVHDLPDDPELLKYELEDALYRALDAEDALDEQLSEAALLEARLYVSEAEAEALRNAAAVAANGDGVVSAGGEDGAAIEGVPEEDELAALSEDELTEALREIVGEIMLRRAVDEEGRRAPIQDLIGELWQLQDLATTPLFTIAGDPVSTVDQRRTAIEMLGIARRGLTDEEARRELEQGLIALLGDSSSDPSLRIAAMRSLRRGRGRRQQEPPPGPDPILEELARLLRFDPDPGVRREAAGELDRYPGSQIARGALADAVTTDADDRVRREAADSLGRVGVPADIPLLQSVAATDTDRRVRQEASEAIERIRNRHN